MRRATTHMHHRRYIAPPGAFDPETRSDPAALLREALDARIRFVEREAVRSADHHGLMIWFKMRVAGDSIDEDGSFTNAFEHLCGTVRREQDGYATWVGPMPLASLQRVLAGRIEWGTPKSHVAQDVIDLFTVARITGLGVTVDELLSGAFEWSRSAATRDWDLGGLGPLSGGKALSLDLKSETNRGDAEVTDASTPDRTSSDPTEVFDGLYDLARATVHELVFGSGSTARPQILPRQPAIVLSVGYTLEFLTRWDRDDALVPAGLVDAGRGAWHRLAVPAARTMDATATLNALEQLCVRTADTFPLIRDLLRPWSDATDDAPETPAEHDEDR